MFAAAVLELPGILLGPLICRVRGHRWHVWTHHAATSLRICIRCSRTD
jgi:hypothetical protein